MTRHCRGSTWPAASRSSTGTTRVRGTHEAAVRGGRGPCHTGCTDAPVYDISNELRARVTGCWKPRRLGVLRGRGDLRPGDRRGVPPQGACSRMPSASLQHPAPDLRDDGWPVTCVSTASPRSCWYDAGCTCSSPSARSSGTPRSSAVGCCHPTRPTERCAASPRELLGRRRAPAPVDTAPAHQQHGLRAAARSQYLEDAVHLALDRAQGEVQRVRDRCRAVPTHTCWATSSCRSLSGGHLTRLQDGPAERQRRLPEVDDRVDHPGHRRVPRDPAALRVVGPAHDRLPRVDHESAQEHRAEQARGKILDSNGCVCIVAGRVYCSWDFYAAFTRRPGQGDAGILGVVGVVRLQHPRRAGRPLGRRSAWSTSAGSPTSGRAAPGRSVATAARHSSTSAERLRSAATSAGSS